MTIETSAPAGGEAIAVITPAAETAENLSISQAARALAAARHKPREAPVEQPEADPVEQPELAEANAAPPEEAHSEDAPTTEPEDNLPPIEPPRSWTKEAKERFESLPRETQEYLAAREQERDRELRRSQNEAAEHRKAVDAERTQVEKARQEYEAKIKSALQVLEREQLRDFPDIKSWDDVKLLQQNDPFRYQVWDIHQKELALVSAQAKEAEESQAREHQSKWAQHVQEENVRVAEFIPELADKTKAAELTNRAAERLSELGFKNEELADLASGKAKLSIYDHRIQRLIFSDLKLAEIQKAKTAAVAKPVPPVQRPGVSKPAGSAASEQIQALTAKLERTGSLKDAQDLRAAQARLSRRA